MHRIACGEPGSLREFVTALKQDRHFAMDFWAMVGDLSARERGTLSDDEMLAMIVKGSSGRTVFELPLSDKVATAELKNMFAGVDVDAPSMETSPSVPPAKPLGEPTAGAEVVRPEDAAPRTEPASATVAETQRSVEEALRRLEETSRELRDQLAALAAIDKVNAQTEVVEPSGSRAKQGGSVPVAKEVASPTPTIHRQSEAMPTATAAPAAGVAESLAMPSEEAVIAPRRSPRILEEREAFAPPQFSMLSHRGFQLRETDDDPSIPVPLSEYAESTSRSIGAGTILLLVLLLAFGVAAIALHLGYGRHQLAAAKAAVLTKIGLFGEELHDVASPIPSAGNSAGAQPQSVSPSSTRPAGPHQTPSNQTQLPQSPQQSASMAREPTGHPHPASDVDVGATARPDAMPADPGAVRVPGPVMQANLLSSRVPVYPEKARSRGIQGPVDLEVVISSTGAVQYAQAISGDPQLRAAAEDAVLRWRYKPYLINGTAVQAVTQVRVNFRLP